MIFVALHNLVFPVAFFIASCVFYADTVDPGASKIHEFSKEVSKAIVDGNVDFINSLLQEGQVLNRTDMEFVFTGKQSVRSILVKPGLKVNIEAVEDWTKSGRAFYRIFYIAKKGGSYENLQSMTWMVDYAVCMFEIKKGKWSVPYTFCYVETDWQ